MSDAAAGRQRALAAAQAGDRAGAARLFAEVAARFPADARLLNSAGSFHASVGEDAEALRYYERALAADPLLGEAAINRAVVLTRTGRAAEAAAALVAGEQRWQALPRYWTARAAAELALGRPSRAAESYDRALARDPAGARPLAGRARAALERGEADAAERHRRALAANPGDPALLLGLAEALAAAGSRTEALAITAALAAQAPSWLPGMEAHANLRRAGGAADGFCDHYAAAADGPAGADAGFFLSWSAQLSGVDMAPEAAEAAARGRRRHPGDAPLALAEAAARDAAGDTAGAARLFEAWRAADGSSAWPVHEARHRLRAGDPAAAARLLARTVAEAPGDVAAWSLLDLAWRATGDARAEWLSGQPGLVAELALDLSEAERARAAVVLSRLHDDAYTPVGQSVRRGTQTRGTLFDRLEPEIALVAAAVDRALRRYRAALPPADAGHPLLQHRDAPWRLAGSWSIRLDGAGHHQAHVHPHGIVSSAAYFLVPDEVDEPDRPGWLEIGRPPPDLKLNLPPFAAFRPRAGYLVLFPSTLFHGTRPIRTGRRMSVAFDVAA